MGRLKPLQLCLETDALSHFASPLGCTVGSHPDCDLIINDKHVSKRHARFTLENDTLFVEDLNSTNGVYLANTPIKRKTPLSCMQTALGLGQYRITVQHLQGGGEAWWNTKKTLSITHSLHSEFISRHEKTIGATDKVIDQTLRHFLCEKKPTLPLWVRLDQLHRRLLYETTGFGPIHALFDDSEVSEIMINGPKKVFVIRAGKMQQLPLAFLSEASLQHCIRRIIAPTGRSIDDSSPTVDARIPNLARVHAIIPPLATNGSTLTIRKNTIANVDLDHLTKNQTLTLQASEFLKAAVQCRQNIVVVGGTDTGKTTFLRVLADSIDHHQRLITIEDTAELNLKRNHLVALESRPANAEGKGTVPIRMLVKNALRMRPDRIIIGECRGVETLDMLQAMNTGHKGSMTTIHASSNREAISRLESMALLSGMDLPLNAIRRQIAAAINLLVYCERTLEGKRQLQQISEIAGMEGDTVLMHEIFSRNHLGQLQPSGIIPRFITEEKKTAWQDFCQIR